MKRNLSTELFAIILISIICTLFMLSNNVYGYSSSMLRQDKVINIDDSTSRNEGKLMRYDVKTGETTEVNTEELKQLASLLSDNDIDTLPAYNSNNILQANQAVSDDEPFEVVTDTSLCPYKGVCRLTFNMASNGEEAMGSGSLVGKNILLTTAHCVFDDTTMKQNTNFTVYPGCNGNVYYGGSCGYKTVYYYEDWITGKNDLLDIAVCVLQQDLGTLTNCYLGVWRAGTDSDLMNLDVALLGYPFLGYTVKDSTKQIISRGKITEVDSNYFLYDAEGSKGFSGGPILDVRNSAVTGVHLGISDTTLYSVGGRITESVFNLIKELREET